jgi:chromosome segregation ATPase
MADDFDAAAAETRLRRLQDERKDVTANLPSDWGKQLGESKMEREFQIKEQNERDKAARHAQYERDLQQARAEKQAKIDAVKKDAESRAEKLRRAEEAAKKVQYEQENKQKTREFEEVRKKNEKAIEDSRRLNERLSNPKTTAPERIRLRQESEERLRRENIRTDKINRGWKEPQTPEEWAIEKNKQKMITAANMKRGAQEIISKAPSYFDRTITGIFSPVVETATHKPKVSASKGIVQESKQFGRATSGHAKKPITGGKVSPARNPVYQPVSINQNFMDNILGRNIETVSGRKSEKPKGNRNSMSGLDDFVRRL